MLYFGSLCMLTAGTFLKMILIKKWTHILSGFSLVFLCELIFHFLLFKCGEHIIHVLLFVSLPDLSLVPQIFAVAESLGGYESLAEHP